MNEVSIRVENVSKAYRIGVEKKKFDTLGEKIVYMVSSPFKNFRRLRSHSDHKVDNGDIFWALNGISFDVKQGEVLGIIGKNGAGKSTLLKILSRITPPTNGKIEIFGRAASLLEVGTGFNPELTGRDNVYLNGTILGMTRKEISDKFEKIVEFSGISKFIDTPVKRYSSGMKVRLAFSVAAHLDPEILIIDEVLAVGDAEFQKKCMGKMQDLSGKEGRTVLFVSHDMSAVQRLCSNSILLQHGKIAIRDSTEKVISSYLNSNNDNIYNSSPGSPIELINAETVDNNFELIKSINVTAKIGIRIRYRVNFDLEVPYTLGINLYDELGNHLFSSHDIEFVEMNIFFMKGEYVRVVWIPENLLAEGMFRISVACMSYNPFTVYFHHFDVASFFVFDMIDGKSARGRYTGKMPGSLRPLLKWENNT